jgi:ribose transport system permease protein
MISGGIDLSQGGQIAVGGIISAVLMINFGLPIWLTVIVTLLLGTAFGAFNGWVSVKFNIFPMIVTLGSMLVLQALAYVLSNGYPLFGLPESFKILGQGYVWVIPIPVIIFAVVIAIAVFAIKKTYFGRYLFAIGGNAEAARLAGVNVERMRIIVFAIGGFITSISSLIMLSRTNSAQPAAGTSYPFDCMTAAVLGGVSFAGGEGSISGAVVGVIIIGILNNGLLLMNVDSNWQGVIKGLVLIIAVAVDSIQRKQKKVKIKAT